MKRLEKHGLRETCNEGGSDREPRDRGKGGEGGAEHEFQKKGYLEVNHIVLEERNEKVVLAHDEAHDLEIRDLLLLIDDAVVNLALLEALDNLAPLGRAGHVGERWRRWRGRVVSGGRQGWHPCPGRGPPTRIVCRRRSLMSRTLW